MCAINPTQQSTFTLKVYTSFPIEKMSEEEFDQITIEAALKAEVNLNRDARLRWHVSRQEKE